jgi:predicted ATP-dependent endonuclease of OLD family
MSKVRIESISIKNYRSFGEKQEFLFPEKSYKKPVAIVGYNNSGKTTLMNSILYTLQVKFVSKDTFTINDFHNRNIKNKPEITLKVQSSTEVKFDKNKRAKLDGYHELRILTDGNQIEGSKMEAFDDLEINRWGNRNTNWEAFGATRYFNIFYINFHNIKEEIVTQKTSWGNLKSFLGKHIQKIIDSDSSMSEKKEQFEQEIDKSKDKVLENSKLSEFITLIRKNYTTNLRENDCSVSFGLPNYEDIFLKMMFKVGLNGDSKNLIPINHFGDGYISMFVMAVIQAIAESNTTDECLFLFEEPESFLHENHQEYFYKTVLCGLAEKNHQVIYTTHSDKMLDIFDTKGLIRIETGENNQTIKKYNDIGNFSFKGDEEEVNEETGEVITYSRYNEFIKTIEPNLNKILFSKKVVLVEGPNDVLVYKNVIEKKVLEAIKSNREVFNKKRYVQTYLNFHNISILCHHGKGTALYLLEVCKHFKIDYFVINDWDFEETELLLEQVSNFSTLAELHKSNIYTSSNKTKKGMITTNWNLINAAKHDKIHFNTKKLETVIGYDFDDKNSIKIWNHLNSDKFVINENLFPKKLNLFLELDKLQ